MIQNLGPVVFPGSQDAKWHAGTGGSQHTQIQMSNEKHLVV